MNHEYIDNFLSNIHAIIVLKSKKNSRVYVVYYSILSEGTSKIIFRSPGNTDSKSSALNE